ncbi:MAG TPA: DUF1697 domain-containing protein [Fimbriiglobus sp.]|jgi:uncharacterized protein (DUF1697 family)
MPTYVALLRAVNVGGTGKLPMKDLVKLCTKLGFADVRTFIQSGNVVFRSKLGERAVRTKLEVALTEKMGKPADVIVRTGPEMKAVLAANPFPDAEPAKVGVFLMNEQVNQALMERIFAPTGEKVGAGKREVYVYFPNGMGRSKFKIPKAVGTVRNINSIAKLATMAMS